MKKHIIRTMIVLAVVMLSISFSITGCKQAAVDEVVEAVEAVEEVAEEVEEAIEENMDVIDPWFEENREGLDKYRGSIDYVGEFGAIPTWDTELFLTLAEVEQVKQGNPETGEPWKVGFVMDASAGDYTTSQVQGMKDVFEHCGMELIGTVDPQFDTAVERSGVEDLLTAGADIIIGAPIDATASAESFRPALDAGKPFVIWSNIPAGYEYGTDYVGVASAMAQDLATFTVDIMREDVTEPTEVAFIYFDAVFWVVNLIDGIVKAELEADPNFEIVEELGFGLESEVFDLVSAALQRNPGITRIYAVWNVPATFAADACAQLDRPDVKIGTFGVDAPTLVSVLSGGNISGTVSDNPYQIGANLAILAAHGAIDKTAPEFTITPAIPITVDNMEEAWTLAQRLPLPASVAELLD